MPESRPQRCCFNDSCVGPSYITHRVIGSVFITILITINTQTTFGKHQLTQKHPRFESKKGCINTVKRVQKYYHLVSHLYYIHVDVV